MLWDKFLRSLVRYIVIDQPIIICTDGLLICQLTGESIKGHKETRNVGINIDVCKTLMPPFPNIWMIGLTFDPDLWVNDLSYWVVVETLYRCHKVTNKTPADMADARSYSKLQAWQEWKFVVYLCPQNGIRGTSSFCPVSLSVTLLQKTLTWSLLSNC